MLPFTSTTLITASPERVWSVLADVARWPEWLPAVATVVPLGSRSLQLGARYRLLPPQRRPAVWTVTEVIPLHSFTWESRGAGVRTIAHHSVMPVSGAMSIVTLRVAYSGLLAVCAGLFAGCRAQTCLEREAAALKRRVETLSEREYRAAWLRTAGSAG